jgi:hypothetical protein
MTICHRSNRGFRKAGCGVIEAFYDGFSAIKRQDFDYIVKLDGDLSFKPDYFEKCFKHFTLNPRLGIGGGTIFNLVSGQLKIEKVPRFHVRGATKIYTKACWAAIGGLIKAPGWDTLDEVKANMKGFKTQTFPDLPLTHYRYTGGAEGTWKNWIKNGRGSYICGYHPIFVFVKCLIRMFKKPYVLMSLALFWGYFSGYFVKEGRISDKELIQYIRKQQINRLLFRKSIWE